VKPRTFMIVAAGLIAAIGAACDDDPTVPNREYMPDMVSSVAYDSFAPNPNTRDGRTLMAPPAGTIPRGYQPLHFAPGPKEAERAGRELTNPIPDGPLVRQRGEIAFQRWCSPCHGHEGLGDGLVAKRFPRPPALTAEHARALPDGRLFHIVSFGQGVMPAYGQQVVQEDRWKIVRFVRQLQASATAPVAAAAPAQRAAAPPAPALEGKK
jgi:mono/diheme cytochrome c family protein